MQPGWRPGSFGTWPLLTWIMVSYNVQGSSRVRNVFDIMSQLPMQVAACQSALQLAMVAPFGLKRNMRAVIISAAWRLFALLKYVSVQRGNAPLWDTSACEVSSGLLDPMSDLEGCSRGPGQDSGWGLVGADSATRVLILDWLVYLMLSSSSPVNYTVTFACMRQWLEEFSYGANLWTASGRTLLHGVTSISCDKVWHWNALVLNVARVIFFDITCENNEQSRPGFYCGCWPL